MQYVSISVVFNWTNDGARCAYCARLHGTYASSQNVQADDGWIRMSNPPFRWLECVFAKYFSSTIDESFWCSLLLDSNGKTINNKSNFTPFRSVRSVRLLMFFSDRIFSLVHSANDYCVSGSGLSGTYRWVTWLWSCVCGVLYFCLLFEIMPSNAWSKQWWIDNNVTKNRLVRRPDSGPTIFYRFFVVAIYAKSSDSRKNAWTESNKSRILAVGQWWSLVCLIDWQMTQSNVGINSTHQRRELHESIADSDDF